MTMYEADTEADYEAYDDDDDSDQGVDDVTALRLAQLEAENARLRAQVGKAPAKPVGDLHAAMVSAQTQEEVWQAIEAHNAAIRASLPPEPEPEIDHAELQQRIANAQSQEEVLEIIHAAGGYSKDNPRGDN